MELRPYIEEPLSNDAASLNFMSLDLRPRIRHDFVLSNRCAVDEYWRTLEYCYAASNRKAALYAFPGSVVHEVIFYSVLMLYIRFQRNIIF
jgi:general transcription factor 3C polypeptide 1